MTCVSCGSPVVQAAPRRRGQPAICARCALTASEAIALLLAAAIASFATRKRRLIP